MVIISPVQLFLEKGDGHRKAITLLDFINSRIAENFNKETMSAEVTINYNIDAPTQLFIIKEMQPQWLVSFEKDDGITFATVVAAITPEEKELYLK